MSAVVKKRDNLIKYIQKEIYSIFSSDLMLAYSL